MICTILQCPNVMCLYKWEYKGSSRFYASCPSCKYKVRIPKLTEQEISAGSAGESYTGSGSLQSTIKETDLTRTHGTNVFVPKASIETIAQVLISFSKNYDKGCYLSNSADGGIYVSVDKIE